MTHSRFSVVNAALIGAVLLGYGCSGFGATAPTEADAIRIAIRPENNPSGDIGGRLILQSFELTLFDLSSGRPLAVDSVKLQVAPDQKVFTANLRPTGGTTVLIVARALGHFDVDQPVELQFYGETAIDRVAALSSGAVIRLVNVVPDVFADIDAGVMSMSWPRVPHAAYYELVDPLGSQLIVAGTDTTIAACPARKVRTVLQRAYVSAASPFFGDCGPPRER